MDCMRDTSAEYAIISAAMADPGCAVNLAALPEDLFTAPPTQAMHRAIKRLVQKGQQQIDVVVLCDACRVDMAEPEQDVIQASMAGLPSMYGSYEAILTGCRKRRILADVASNLLRYAPDPTASVDALMAESIKAMQATDGGAAIAVSAKDALMAFQQSLDEAKKGRCYTGIADLDRLTGGIRGGKLVVLGARPGVGKSALALAMAVHVARHTGPVLIVSLEMDEAEVMSRVVAMESGVDVQRMESGSMDEDEWAKMYQAYPEVSALPLHISTRAHTPLQVLREAARLKHKKGLALIVVDYIQLMRADGKKSSRYEEISEISRELKLMAADLDVPVLALTQFNRSSEQSVGGKAERRMPTMAEAKDSGSIEQDANLFLILYPPPEPTEAGPEWEAYHMCAANGWEYQIVTVAKNRQGRTGKFPIGFEKGRMRFHSLDLRRAAR